MKQKILTFIVAGVVTAGALVLTATDGFSFGSLGDDVNSICAPDVVYTGDCALCHTGGKADPTPAKDAYLTGGTTLTDYFCPTTATSASLPTSPNQVPMGTADFDGDGLSDLLVRNRLNGHWHLYLMAGNTITPYLHIDLPKALNQELAGIADFNGDGNADILLRNSLNGEWHMYLMNGPAITPYLNLELLPLSLNHQLAGLNDSDGDGNADILLWNRVNGFWNMYYMNGPTISGSVRFPN